MLYGPSRGCALPFLWAWHYFLLAALSLSQRLLLAYRGQLTDVFGLQIGLSCRMELFIMLFQVAMLSELHWAEVTLIWFFAVVLPEVVLDVAALAEGLVAALEFADE